MHARAARVERAAVSVRAVTDLAVGQPRDLRDEVDDVHAEPVDAAVEPPRHHVVDRAADVRVLPVEVRLLAREQVQVVLARRLVVLPRGAAEERAPVVGLGPGRAGLHALARRTPPVPVAPGVGTAGARPAEPGVLVRGVVHHQVHDDPQAPVVRRGQQPVEVLERPEHRVDVLVVADVVAVVVLGRAVHGREPHDVDAQGHEVVEPPLDPGQVADPVAVRVLEGPRVDLVDHRARPPGRLPGGPAADRAGRRGGGRFGRCAHVVEPLTAPGRVRAGTRRADGSRPGRWARTAMA